jgi:ferredoxin
MFGEERAMRTRICWFSGTGNSLVIARELAARIGDCELLPLADRAAVGQPAPERLGLVFPVYAFGPPLIVAEYLEKAAIAEGTYVFSVATMGGIAGMTHAVLRKVLRDRGIDLAAGWSVVMPGNCISLYPPPREKTQRRQFGKASRKVAAIAQDVREGKRGPSQDSWPPTSWIGGALYKWARPHLRDGDKSFRVTDACTHCGVCARVCPVENITMVDGIPQWQHHCEQCYGCINWCPERAIEVGKWTRGRRRYHHPDVALEDVCLREG